MARKLVIKKSVILNFPAFTVWEALTNPELTKKYFFNCEVVSTWKKGGLITFQEVSDEKIVEHVKGTIKRIKPGKYLSYTFYSRASGPENIPSKPMKVIYKLSEDKDGNTKLFISEGDFGRDITRFNENSEGWENVLNGLKALLEA